MKSINNFIENKIQLILSIFIIIQPILDAITGITLNVFKTSIPFAPGVRCIFMLFLMYYLFFINKEKKYIKKTIPIILYTIIFITYTFIKKRQFISLEMPNFLNTFYLPVILIGLLNIFEHKKIKLNLKLIVLTYSIYLILTIVPNITNTAFQSYEYSKVGKVGWFPLANVIGNSLSILSPLIIYFIINKEKSYLLKILIIISTLYVFVSIGTKVPVLALGICIIINFIYFFIKWIKEKQKTKVITTSIISLTAVIVIIFLIPKTSFYKNIQIHKDFLGVNNFTEIITNVDMIDHFVFSQRLTFLKTIHNSNKPTNIETKLIGLGHVKKYNGDISTKTIEIDYLDVIYENGILGSLAFYCALIPVFIEAIKKLKEKTLINLEYKISITLILLITAFAGHMLTSAAISIYVAFILVFITKGGLNEKIK